MGQGREVRVCCNVTAAGYQTKGRAMAHHDVGVQSAR
jgi:hypothetical protein